VKALLLAVLVALGAGAMACRDGDGDSAASDEDATRAVAATASDGTPAVGGGTAPAGDGELTLEDFFQEMKAALDAQISGVAAVPDPQINDDDTLDDGERARVLANLDAQTQMRDDLRATLAALQPPDQAAQAIDELLAALDAQIAVLIGLRPDFESADSPDDLEALSGQVLSGAEVAGPFLQFSQACSALQAIANDSDVAVTLPC
jgi:hypothetical protein